MESGGVTSFRKCGAAAAGAERRAGPIASLGVALVVLAGACALLPAQQDEAAYARLREAMVREQIAAERWSGALAVRDARVLDAMRRVPRHLFVPPAQMRHAYEDRPLLIGHGQTISQPYMVAKMTELAEPRATDRALEIGTGSGYQAAVLSLLVREVYTMEIVEPLGREAAERLRALGFKNVEVRIGDGYAGWPEKAPFDVVLVTAAPPELPMALVEQLKPGGRMVVPVGAQGATQTLRVITKGRGGPRDYTSTDVMPVLFVPMVPAKKN
jgi:protein-L-isoaspartate(D-aspartate) O-methyltransferase